MRDKFLVGNWKMHGSKQSIAQLLTQLKEGLKEKINPKVKMLVCPPYIFLDQVQTLLKGSQIGWAAQNMAASEEGPYTGEISVAMLYEFGCRYVLLGHSERRMHYGETNEGIAKKFKLAVDNGITPILCIGETQEQREKDKTNAVLQNQLELIIRLGRSLLEKGIIAYEPVWAIGTGVSASSEQIEEVHKSLRRYIASLKDKLDSATDLAQRLPILYGGSINLYSAQDLFQNPDVDGGLVGGASLDAAGFLAIYKTLASPSNIPC